MIKRNKKWKLYIYASNQCIKAIKINDDENPFEKTYAISVYCKKHIFGSNFAKIIVKPIRLKYTNEAKKQIHIEAKLYEGVEI